MYQTFSSRDSEIKELVLRSQQGDEDAFGEVFDIFAEPIYRFLYVRIRHKENAEDLLSLTFLKAWKNLSSYTIRSNAKFSTWLFQICHNVISDYFRNKKELVNLEEYMLKDLSVSNVQNEVHSRILYGRVLEALKQLSSDYQNILTLRFINEFSIEECAKIMERSSGAVRVMQVRALKVLRRLVL